MTCQPTLYPPGQNPVSGGKFDDQFQWTLIAYRRGFRWTGTEWKLVFDTYDTRPLNTFPGKPLIPQLSQHAPPYYYADSLVWTASGWCREAWQTNYGAEN